LLKTDPAQEIFESGVRAETIEHRPNGEFRSPAAYPICKGGRPQGNVPSHCWLRSYQRTDQSPLGQGFLFSTCRKLLNRKEGTPPVAG
jgi:hypothetical protein